MPTVKLFKQDGSQAGDMELMDSVFGVEPNRHVLHEAVVKQQASLRQGTHDVKNRSEVRGGGRKPWRQKGTGRARQGSIRAPHWVGGATVFGPTPRSYSYKMPKKMRRLALKSAFSSKVNDDSVLVLDELSLDAPKTKKVVNMLTALDINTKTLIVTSESDETLARSANNLQSVKVINIHEANVLDLLTHDKLILTKEAAEKAGEVLA